MALHAALLGLALLAGCAPLGRQHADMQSLGFMASSTDARIWHEPGGEAFASRVGEALDPAIFRVESLHGEPFRSPPQVYVCATLECYARLVRTPGLTAAVVPDNRLVLSPRLDGRESHRLPGILTHELSHLHLGQRLGHYTPWIPIWFHEGLATLAAEGAGAEFASDEAACGAWRSGRRVDFDRRDTPDRRHRAADFSLNMHEFYRQSWRMVEKLQQYDPAAFREWLKALQEGVDFHIAFAGAYNTGLDPLAQSLLNAIAAYGDSGARD